MNLTLYSYWRSSCSWRVRMALAYKSLPYRYHAVHLVKDGGEQNTEFYRALNPSRTVPMLEVEDGGRVRRLTQSMAILEFLEDIQPSPALRPADPFLRARARALSEHVNSGIQPLQNLAVMQHVKSQLGGDDKAWSQHWIRRGFDQLETLVQETAGRFSVGDQLSLADLYLLPQLYNARRFEVPVDAYPTLLRIEDSCRKLSVLDAAHPDRQPDAPKT